MGSTLRHARRRSSIASGVALSLVIVVFAGGPVAGQDATLCDALDLDQLHALGELRYVESEYGGDRLCLLEVAPEQEGPHSISLWLNEIPFGMTFAEMRETMREQDPTYEDVTVGGLDALIEREASDGASVFVGLDELGLTVTVDIAHSAEGGGLDEGDYALAVAELVVAGLETSSAGPAASSDVLEPPAVDGVTWRTSRSLAGAEFESELGEVELQLWDVLLSEAGADLEQASMLDANAFDAGSDARLGNYVALTISGTDASVLAPALVDWLGGLQGEAFGATAVTLAGRDVTQVSLEGEPQGYIYAEGDTLHLITMSAEAAGSIVEALP